MIGLISVCHVYFFCCCTFYLDKTNPFVAFTSCLRFCREVAYARNKLLMFLFKFLMRNGSRWLRYSFDHANLTRPRFSLHKIPNAMDGGAIISVVGSRYVASGHVRSFIRSLY